MHEVGCAGPHGINNIRTGIWRYSSDFLSHVWMWSERRTFLLPPEAPVPLGKSLWKKSSRKAGVIRLQAGNLPLGVVPRNKQLFVMWDSASLLPLWSQWWWWLFSHSVVSDLWDPLDYSWNSSALATWCKELTHWKRPWCWERLKAGREGDDRGWNGWMASPTWWAWVWVGSRCWWWTGNPGVLQSMGSQRLLKNATNYYRFSELEDT